MDSNGYPTDLGCEKFGSQSDGVYVIPECDYSHQSSSSSHDLGVFLILADSSDRFAIHDGDNNTAVHFQQWNGSNSSAIVDIAYGNNKFVAARAALGIYESYDNLSAGMNWSPVHSSASTFEVEFGGGDFLAWTDTAGGEIRCSSDNYSARYVPGFSGRTINSASYGDGKWVVVGENGYNAYSNDCLNWSSGNTISNDYYFEKIVFGKNKFVTIASDTNDVYFASSDNMTWSMMGNSDSTHGSLRAIDVTFVDNEFFFLNETYGRIAMTNNVMSINWNQYYGLTFSPDIIAGGQNKLLVARTDTYKLGIGTKSNMTGGWSERTTSFGVKSIYFF